MRRRWTLKRLWTRLRAPRTSDQDISGLRPPLQRQTYNDVVWENAVEAFQESPDEDFPMTPYVRDRVAAIRAELVLKAERMNREARVAREAARRRRRTAIGATATVMLVGVAGASALSAGPSLDRWFATLTQGVEKSDSEDRDIGLSSLPRDSLTGAGDRSELLEIPWSGAGEKGAAGAYVDRGGDVCFAVAEPVASGEARGSISGCAPPSVISDRLATETVFLSNVHVGETTVLSGYASPDVDAVQVTSPSGGLQVLLSEPWTPDLPNATPFRVVVAVIHPDFGDGPTRSSQTDSIADLRQYLVKAHIQNGRVIDPGR